VNARIRRRSTQIFVCQCDRLNLWRLANLTLTIPATHSLLSDHIGNDVGQLAAAYSSTQFDPTQFKMGAP
jgi:hypothetical protein